MSDSSYYNPADLAKFGKISEWQPAMGGKFLLQRAWRYPVFSLGLGLATYVMYRTGSKTSTGAIIAAGWIFGLTIILLSTASYERSLKATIRLIGFLIVSAVTALITKALANTGYFAALVQALANHAEIRNRARVRTGFRPG